MGWWGGRRNEGSSELGSIIKIQALFRGAATGPGAYRRRVFFAAIGGDEIVKLVNALEHGGKE